MVVASPNHSDRRGRHIDALVLHYTGMPTAAGALSHLTAAASEVSSHYLIDEEGGLFQLVPETRRAWHAGRSFWQGERDLNSVSIGIEIANAGHQGGLPAFPDRQIEAVIALCRDILARRAIPATRVLGHSDIAPGRKIDPGERFPWRRLAQAGVGFWLPERTPQANAIVLAAGARGEAVAALQEGLARWGMDVPTTGVFDATTRLAIVAVQQRFRPSGTSGIADDETQTRVQSLAEHAPGPLRG